MSNVKIDMLNLNIQKRAKKIFIKYLMKLE